MKKEIKEQRYGRLFEQIESLLKPENGLIANMATITAVLYHKMDHYFWVGFYLIYNDKLIVGPYQGPLACMILEKNKGVCWAGVIRKETIVVPDVEKFPGHIACDSRSKSESVVPGKNNTGEIIGVLDVDSKNLSSFDETDAFWLERIAGLLKNINVSIPWDPEVD